MRRLGRTLPRLLVCLLAGWLCGGSTPAASSTVLLKDGRQLQGTVGRVNGLADPPSSKSNEPGTIKFLDNGLTRVFIPGRRIQSILEAEKGGVKQKIGIYQDVARNGARIARIGPTKVTPFDQFGHRTLSMVGEKGQIDVIQGITEITPVYTKVQALSNKNKQLYVLDMRVATRSIPLGELKTLLARRIEPKNMEKRLDVVRLFLEMELYDDAEKELKKVIADFPEKSKESGLAKQVRELRQLQARRIVKEVEVRRKAGQHDLACGMLEKFPTDDVASTILQQVREMLEDYRDMSKKLDEAGKELEAHIKSIEQPETHRQCEELFKEMSQELGFNTFDRLASYLRFSSDKAKAAAIAT